MVSGLKWSGHLAFVPDCKKVYLCNVMERQEINSTIINYLSPYRPERIGIFGSFARHEEKKDSDIDILVKFKENNITSGTCPYSS